MQTYIILALLPTAIMGQLANELLEVFARAASEQVCHPPVVYVNDIAFRIGWGHIWGQPYCL